MPSGRKRKRLARANGHAARQKVDADVEEQAPEEPLDDELPEEVGESGEEGEVQFPTDKLHRMFSYMLSSTEDHGEFIARFSQHIDHDDVQECGLPTLASVVDSNTNPPTHYYATNLFNTLKLFKMRNMLKRIMNLASGGNKNGEEKVNPHFDALWMKLLKMPLSPATYRRVLILLPDRVLPHLQSPLLLTDFLLNSYEIGGVISILALNGVFYLMHHHNLEYPEFYRKLYSLLEPDVLRIPQRARFFHLCDLFLSSGYLPEYLVAAFVKRLSRLTLTAPACTQTLLIRLICNLMVRHRGLERLINDPRGPTEMDGDPFLADERDPALCRATESSLWELKSLKNHFVPQVGRAASFVDRGVPELEHPLAELLDTGYDDLMEAEFSREMKDVALTFHRPDGLLSWKEDCLASEWKL